MIKTYDCSCIVVEKTPKNVAIKNSIHQRIKVQQYYTKAHSIEINVLVTTKCTSL
jgi:hypothetical protein